MKHRHRSLLIVLMPALLSLLTSPMTQATDTQIPAATPNPAQIPVNAQGRLLPFRAEYSVSHLGITVATTILSLEARPGHQHLYHSVTTPSGVSGWLFSEKRSEQTLFRLQNQHIKPLHYRYQLEGTRQAREVRVDFDWLSLRATNTAANHSWKMDIPSNTLDKLTVQLGLTLALRRQQSIPVNQVYEYPVADGGRLKTYRFQNMGLSHLETPLGQYQALHLVGRQQRSSNRFTELWLAPALGFLPVRIDQAQGGLGTAHLYLENIEFNPDGTAD